MLLLIWWIYDGYAWLTNAIRHRAAALPALLLGGMGGFLMISLATPHAYEGDGLIFGLGYLVVTALHAGMFVRGVSADELQGDPQARAVQPARRRAGRGRGRDRRRRPDDPVGRRGRHVVADAAVDQRRGLRHRRRALRRAPRSGRDHRARRVDRRARRRHRGAWSSTPRIIVFALLALALNAALWWVYFNDEHAVEEAFHDAAPERRPALALPGVRLLALRPAARGHRRGGRAEEGDRAPYDELDELDRARARRRHRALHRVRHRLPRTFGLPGNRDPGGRRGRGAGARSRSAQRSPPPPRSRRWPRSSPSPLL